MSLFDHDAQDRMRSSREMHFVRESTTTASPILFVYVRKITPSDDINYDAYENFLH